MATAKLDDLAIAECKLTAERQSNRHLRERIALMDERITELKAEAERLRWAVDQAVEYGDKQADMLSQEHERNRRASFGILEALRAVIR